MMREHDPVKRADNSEPRHRSARFAVLGPAFVAAVAYVDPGNVAVNIQAGRQYGYLLVWVLVVASASAGLIQYLSAKLGLVTGASLPELMGRRLHRAGRIGYWLQAEGVAMATDLAEVIGGAIALRLLFGLPLPVGGLIAGLVSLGLLAVQNRRGQRPFETVVTGLLLIICIGFVAGLVVAPPPVADVAAGLIPRFDGLASVLLATGMLGATVMPHAVYLHSALTRDHFGRVEAGPRRARLLRATKVDVIAAMILAGSVNVAMLVLAAAALRGSGGHSDGQQGGTIDDAHAAVTTSLGPVVGALFAIGLLASGLASTSVGCYAGSVIMQGLLRARVSLLVRRTVTLIPALVVLALGADPTSVLVISQVALSFGLPFVLIPLLRLTADPVLMGPDVTRRLVSRTGWAITAAIVVLNAVLVVGLVRG